MGRNMTDLDRALDKIVDHIFGEIDSYFDLFKIETNELLAMRAQIRMEIARILKRHEVLKIP